MHELLAELTSGDDTRAENSIPAIVDLGMAAIPTLLELTRAEEVDSRWWAVRALAASPHTRTENLIPLLSDSASEVRAAAARFTITRITDVYLARVDNPDKDFRAFLARCEAWRGPALGQLSSVL